MHWNVTRLETKDAWACFDVVVDGDSPLFEGHFPGHPVLPAVAQIDLLAVLLRRIHGASACLTGVDGARFERPVRPGDRLRVRLSAGARELLVRFRIDRSGSIVSRGSLRWGVEEDR